jgi:hypothetical protein
MHFPSSKLAFGLLTMIAVSSALPKGALAITVEVARRCDAATAKAFPPRVPGNPAAGSAAGSGSDQRAYYNKCVAEAEASQGAGKTDSPNRPTNSSK